MSDHEKVIEAALEAFWKENNEGTIAGCESALAALLDIAREQFSAGVIGEEHMLAVLGAAHDFLAGD